MKSPILISDVNQAMAGNQRAYKVLYDHVVPILTKIIKQKLFGINSDTLNDVTQDVMLKIFSKLHLYNQKRNFISWAISITLHHCIDIGRKRNVRVIYDDDLVYSTANQLSNQIHQPTLETKLDILSFVDKHTDEEYKKFVFQRFVFGMKQKEIATCLNKPLGSISGQQSYMLQHIRNKMRDLHLCRNDFF